MRILLVHNFAPWDARAGGGQRVQHEIAAHAAAAGNDVRVLHLGDTAHTQSTPYAVVGIPERRAGGLRLFGNAVAVARRARGLMRSWLPDVVHATAAEGGLLPFVLPPGVALVATSHHPDPPALPRRLPRGPSAVGALRRLQAAYLEAHLLRRAHRVVAVSRWGANVLGERGYLTDVRPVAVVPNGVGAEWFAHQRGSGAPPIPEFLFVGRLEPAKGWDVLLEALARPDAPPGARLALAGTGPEARAVAERASALGLADRVHPLDRVPPDEIRARLAQATALVLPSRRENYPLVLLEAMAAGVPVVATTVGGVPEMVVDARSGLLVPPDDPAALARALTRVATDESLRRRLIDGAREVAERHRWERIVARLTEEYELARELARPVPRAPASPLSVLYREAGARAAARRVPQADSSAPPRDPRRIAIVRPGRLGDLLLADPLLAALAERWPAVSLELVTDVSDRVPPWMLDPGNGTLTQRTLALRRGPDAWRRPSDHERAASLSELARAWRAAPPDVLLFAVDLGDPVQHALAAELAAAAPGAWRAGLASGGAGVALLHAAVQPGPTPVHEIERLLRLAERVGADARFRLPRLPSSPSPLPPWESSTVVVHPGASRSTKRWPLARWGELAARLAQAGARTVVVGDGADRVHVPALGIPFDERTFLDRVGALDLDQLAAAIAGADAFAGNDSFPFHLAAAAGIPAVGLIGPGALSWTAYPAPHVGLARVPVVCSPRHGEECPVYTTCPHGACMQSIRVEVVADALIAALSGRPAVV